MIQFDYDAPISQRPAPDNDLLKRVYNHTLRNETPSQKWIRQNFEVSAGATRVALDAIRKLWPHEADHPSLRSHVQSLIVAEKSLATAFAALDLLDSACSGELVHKVQTGEFTSEDMDRLEAQDGA